MNDRMIGLLRKTAVDLREGISPLSHSFLVEHEVTADEAYTLSELLACGIDLVVGHGHRRRPTAADRAIRSTES